MIRPGAILLIGLVATACAARAEGVGGWTARAVPNSSPVAVSRGPGIARMLAIFCLSGQPFLAIDLRPAPAAETLRVSFRFSDGEVTAQARREAGAGGDHVIALGTVPELPARLAGHNSSVDLAIAGKPAGTLSLAGSSRAISAALGTCGG